MTEQELRDNYLRAISTRASTDRGACVAPDAIVALVQRDGPEAARLATLDHVMSCDACRQEFDILNAIERAGAGNSRRAAEGIHWRRYATVAVAASLLLAVGLGPGRRLWEHRVADDVARGGEGTAIVLVAPDEAAIASGAVTFTWRGVPNATRYTLEVLGAGGDVIFSRQTADTSLTVGQLGVASGSYHWLVRATGDDGIERRSLPRSIRAEAVPR